MNKEITLLLIFNLIYLLTFSQSDTEYEIYRVDFASKITNDVKKCETGKKQALKDAKKGTYNYLIFERYTKEDFLFYKYYRDYLRNKYNIILINGYVARDFTKCYSTEMKKLIYQKYGEGIISKSKKEVLKEYKKIKPK